MFTKSAVKGILAITTLTASSLVSATIFDFAAIANGDGSYGTAGGEYGATAITFTKGGLSVTATGRDTEINATYNAYLDSSWFHDFDEGGNGGLGVCKDLDGGQCNPGFDDNVTINESLMLTFDSQVTITDILFRNGEHNPTFAGDATFDLIIDSGLVKNYPLISLFSMDDLTGTTFEFMNLNATDTDDYRFYISTLTATVVPVPAAAWLFGSGLIGLVGMARRKKA